MIACTPTEDAVAPGHKVSDTWSRPTPAATAKAIVIDVLNLHITTHCTARYARQWTLPCFTLGGTKMKQLWTVLEQLLVGSGCL